MRALLAGAGAEVVWVSGNGELEVGKNVLEMVVMVRVAPFLDAYRATRNIAQAKADRYRDKTQRKQLQQQREQQQEEERAVDEKDGRGSRDGSAFSRATTGESAYDIDSISSSSSSGGGVGGADSRRTSCETHAVVGGGEGGAQGWQVRKRTDGSVATSWKSAAQQEQEQQGESEGSESEEEEDEEDEGRTVAVQFWIRPNSKQAAAEESVSAWKVCCLKPKIAGKRLSRRQLAKVNQQRVMVRAQRRHDEECSLAADGGQTSSSSSSSSNSNSRAAGNDDETDQAVAAGERAGGGTAGDVTGVTSVTPSSSLATEPLDVDEITAESPLVELMIMDMPIDCGILTEKEMGQTRPVLEDSKLKDFQGLSNFLLGCVDQSIVATDLEGKIVFWNRYATKLYQWQPEEVHGKRIVDVISSQITKEQGEELMSRLAEGMSWQGEYLCTKRNGTDFVALCTTSPIYNPKGELIGVVGVSQDVSDRVVARERLASLSKNLEKEVEERTLDLKNTNDLLRKENAQRRKAEAELRLASLVATKTDTGVIITDEKGQTLWVNDALKRVTGYELADFLGKPPGRVLQCEETDPATVETIRRALSRSQQICVDIVNRSKSGETYMVNLDIYPCINETDGQVCNFFSLQRLVSDGMRKEDHVLALHTAKAKALHTAKAKALASKFKAEFVMLSSHELKTPIVGIAGMASAMMGSPLDDPEQLRADLRTIVNSSRQLMTLVNNMIDLPRIESGKMSLNVTSFMLPELLTEVCEFARSLGSDDDVAVELQMHSSVPKNISADEEKLKQVLTNLVNNAAKFSRPHTSIKLAVSEAEELVQQGRIPGFTPKITAYPRTFLLFSVEDQGSGIDPASVDRLFAQFVQLHGDMELLGGGAEQYKTGADLGLHVCSKLMHMMDGHIWLDKTQVNVGTRFCFLLPVSGGGSSSACCTPTDTPPLSPTRLRGNSFGPAGGGGVSGGGAVDHPVLSTGVTGAMGTLVVGDGDVIDGGSLISAVDGGGATGYGGGGGGGGGGSERPSGTESIEKLNAWLKQKAAEQLRQQQQQQQQQQRKEEGGGGEEGGGLSQAVKLEQEKPKETFVKGTTEMEQQQQQQELELDLQRLRLEKNEEEEAELQRRRQQQCLVCEIDDSDDGDDPSGKGDDEAREDRCKMRGERCTSCDEAQRAACGQAGVKSSPGRLTEEQRAQQREEEMAVAATAATAAQAARRQQQQQQQKQQHEQQQQQQRLMREKEQHQQQQQQQQQGAEKRLRELRVLVVDDNKVNVKVLVRLLKQTGIEADFSMDGQQALDAFQKTHYELAFIDIGMPVLDGLETAKAIRSGVWGSKPILVAWTAYASGTDRANCLRAGFNHHLPKPVTAPQLKAFLHDTLPQMLGGAEVERVQKAPS